MEELRRQQPRLDLTQHIKVQILQTMYAELGMEMPNFAGGYEINGTDGGDDDDAGAVPESVKLQRTQQEDDGRLDFLR